LVVVIRTRGGGGREVRREEEGGREQRKEEQGIGELDSTNLAFPLFARPRRDYELRMGDDGLTK